MDYPAKGKRGKSIIGTVSLLDNEGRKRRLGDEWCGAKGLWGQNG